MPIPRQNIAEVRLSPWGDTAIVRSSERLDVVRLRAPYEYRPVLTIDSGKNAPTVYWRANREVELIEWRRIAPALDGIRDFGVRYGFTLFEIEGHVFGSSAAQTGGVLGSVVEMSPDLRSARLISRSVSDVQWLPRSIVMTVRDEDALRIVQYDIATGVIKNRLVLDGVRRPAWFH